MTRAPASDEDLVRLFGAEGVNHDSAAHFRGRLERRLLINRCGECGRWHHPPRPLCPRCWSTSVAPTEVSGVGVIHLLVLLHQGPPAPEVDYAAGPHPVAAVELVEQPGLRFTSTVVGVEPRALHVGDRVRLAWIERGGVPVPAFRPVSGEGV